MRLSLCFLPFWFSLNTMIQSWWKFYFCSWLSREKPICRCDFVWNHDTSAISWKITTVITPGGGGGGVLRPGFAGCVPLASQNPHPIIVYSVAKYRPHLSHFGANVIVILRTEFNASRLLNFETTAGTIFQPWIFLFEIPAYQNFLIPKIPKICDPILVTLLKM